MSRTTFVKEARIETRALQLSDIIIQVAAMMSQLLASMAVLTILFTLIPELDHLPSLLMTGNLVT